MLSNFFSPRKSFLLWDNEKYGRARQATDDNVIRRMRFACWITKATDTHSEYVIRNFFYTATVVSRTFLIVTLHIRYLSCYNQEAVCLLRGTSWVFNLSVWRAVGLNSSVAADLMALWFLVTMVRVMSHVRWGSREQMCCLCVPVVYCV